MCGNKNYISGSLTVYLSVWQSCLYVLQDELPSQQFSMWVRPLQAESTEDTLTIYAPNRFVLDWVREKYLNRINELLVEICGDEAPELRFDVGSKPLLNAQLASCYRNTAYTQYSSISKATADVSKNRLLNPHLNRAINRTLKKTTPLIVLLRVNLTN